MDPLSIITQTIPPIRTILAYSEQLQAIGGTPPYAWNVEVGFGALPPGMSLSAAGTLSAAAGNIPNNATGSYSFRLRVTDGVLASVTYDYTVEVVPSGFSRVHEFLLDNRLYSVIRRFLLNVTDREKTELHFFRSGLAALGETFVHTDQDIKILNWGGSDLSLRDVLDLLSVAASNSIATINSIGPDTIRNFGIAAGAGLTVTGQPNGIRLDILPGGAGGVQEQSIETDVTPFGTTSVSVPVIPDVVEAWIRDDVSSKWFPASEESDRIGKFINPLFAAEKYAACCTGTDSLGSRPVVHTIRYDGTGPQLVLERYDGLTLASEEQVAIPLPGAAVSEPLLMVDFTAPYTLVIACIVNNGPTNVLFYQEAPLPESYLSLTIPVLIPHTILDPLAIDIEASQGSAYDTNNKRLFGAVATTGAGQSAIIAVQSVIAGPTYSSVLLDIPLGGGGLVTGGVRSGATGTDTLDVTVDRTAVPNDVLWLQATGRWTGAGGSLDLYAYTAVGWPATPLPPAPPPLAAWGLPALAGAASDGMELVQGAISLDLNAAGKDALGVVFVLDEWLITGAPPVTPPGPPNHRSKLFYIPILDVSTGIPVPFGPYEVTRPGIYLSPDEGRFGRWWTDSDEAKVYFLNPSLSLDRVFMSRLLFDSTGPLGEVEEVLNFGTQNSDALFGLSQTRPAHTTWSGTAYTELPRAFVTLADDAAVPFISIDSPVRPDTFRTYYDGSANVVFENETPFTWHVKLEALTNVVDVAPANLMVACWQLAQGLQLYWNANSYYPSASCNPPGPGGIQGTVWNETETGTISTLGQVFYPTYYTITPGTWDLNGGATAQAYYYAISAAGAAVDQWLVFRYNYIPGAITTAESAIDAYLSATPPAAGVYTLADIDVLYGTSFATTYVGAPYTNYQYFCFANTAGTGYYHGFFSTNYIHNAQAFGPAPSGGLSEVPFIEMFTVPSDATPGVYTEFTISRLCRYAEVMVNGLEYFQSVDWQFGTTMNKVRYLNNPLPSGYPLHTGDVVAIKYLV